MMAAAAMILTAFAAVTVTSAKRNLDALLKIPRTLLSASCVRMSRTDMLGKILGLLSLQAAFFIRTVTRKMAILPAVFLTCAVNDVQTAHLWIINVVHKAIKMPELATRSLQVAPSMSPPQIPLAHKNKR